VLLHEAERAAADREQLRSELGLPSGRPVILMISKLQPHKGPSDLLDAYCRLSPDGRREPEALLIFVGDGPLRKTLEVRVVSLGWNSVRFTGFRNQSEPPRFYDLCDAFVLPSLREPWGLVVNEIMNAARPVVVSNAAGCTDDLVVEGQTGFTFAPGDIAALTTQLRVLVQGPALARRMGRAGRDRVAAFDFHADMTGLRRALLFACRS
jgi:glycosyltransferase involved in cell wall biosynthesis